MLVKQLITLSLSMDELLYRRRQHLVCGHGVSQAHSSHRNQRLIECVCSDARGEKTALITEKRLFLPRCRLLIRPFPRQPPDCLPGSERQGSDSTLLRGASHSTLRQSSTLLQHPATAPCYRAAPCYTARHCLHILIIGARLNKITQYPFNQHQAFCAPLCNVTSCKGCWFKSKWLTLSKQSCDLMREGHTRCDLSLSQWFTTVLSSETAIRD